MKSKSKASQRKKLLERENEKLKKDLTAMQQQFNDMLMRKVVNTEEGKKQAQGKTGKDENLLDDLLTGSKIEEAQLVAADDFEAPVELSTTEV